MNTDYMFLGNDAFPNTSVNLTQGVIFASYFAPTYDIENAPKVKDILKEMMTEEWMLEGFPNRMDQNSDVATRHTGYSFLA